MSTISFYDAFNEYYKLKNKYDKSLKRLSEKITISGDSNKKEKYENAKICIKCKQKGGTLFTQKENLLIAKCNSSNPCTLNIQLQRATNKNIKDELTIINNSIITEKQKTILAKLDYLFSIKDAEITKIDFNNFKKNFIELTKKYENYLNYYNNLTNNKETKSLLKQLNKNLFDQIEITKNNIIEFNKTSNIKFIKESIDDHINIIKPLIQKIQTLNYPLNYIYTDDNDINYLIQNNFNYTDLDIIINNTENKVISFNL